MVSIRQQLEWANDMLAAASDSARLDSEILLAHCLGKERSYLLTWPERELSPEELGCYRELVRRRLKPEPVAYLVGYREFYSLRFKTTPHTLVPRPETEMLVDAVLAQTEIRPELDVLELGTGTGAIALAIKQHAPDCLMTATDISSAALAVANANAHRLALDVRWIESDWYQALAGAETFDVIVSNPPYIAAGDPFLARGDLPAEPRLALTPGPSGLEALRSIIAGAPGHLRAGGMLMLEHGYDQRAAVQNLMREQGFEEVATVDDFNGLPRMTSGVYNRN